MISYNVITVSHGKKVVNIIAAGLWIEKKLRRNRQLT